MRFSINKTAVIASLFLVISLSQGVASAVKPPPTAKPAKPPVATSAPGQPCQPLVKENNTAFVPTWYEYISKGRADNLGHCTTPDIQIVTAGKFDGGGILLILLAIVDILLHIAGVVALAYVVYGGIRYVTSQGSPDKTKQAQSTITDALTGLLIAVIAIALVSFIGHSIG